MLGFPCLETGCPQRTGEEGTYCPRCQVEGEQYTGPMDSPEEYPGSKEERPDPIMTNTNDTRDKTGTCVHCHREGLNIIARKLCGRCYGKPEIKDLYPPKRSGPRAGAKRKKPAAKSAPIEPATPPLEDDAHLTVIEPGQAHPLPLPVSPQHLAQQTRAVVTDWIHGMVKDVLHEEGILKKSDDLEPGQDAGHAT